MCLIKLKSFKFKYLNIVLQVMFNVQLFIINTFKIINVYNLLLILTQIFLNFSYL